jgi:ketosteroid isomerase-like protein
MYRLISVLTMCTAILIGGGLGIGLTHARIADAKEDPEGVFRGFVAALNNGDVANASALLDDDVTLFEPNGDGSFGIVGKKAFVGSVLPDITTSGFKATVRHAVVHGDTVSGTIATSDDTTKAAGVSRYLETFAVRVVDGKIASFDFLYDTSDSATNTYIAYSRSQSNNEEPLPDTIEVPLGPGAEGSQPGTAFLAAASWAGEGVSLIGVQVQPGHAGAQQPADLISGSCAAPGKTVHRLAAVVDGGSFTIVSASVDEILAQGLSIQVHQAGQTDRVNACGAVLAAAVAPVPPAPAPSHIDIKPPATGTGPAPGSGLPSWLLAALVTSGVLAVMGGLGVRRNQPH